MFARPEYAWLLAAVPLAGLGLFLEARRRRQLAGSVPQARWGQRLHAASLLLGVFFLALAAAGPQIGLETSAGPSAPGRLIVALDCSKSMLARDLAPNRLEAAKALVRDVLARVPDLPAGLVIFAGRARLACPVTSDRAGLLAFLDAVGPADAPLGGTNLATALEAAGLALAGGERGAVLLVSDGEETRTAPDAGSLQGPPVLAVVVGGAIPVTVPTPDGGLLKDAAGAPVRVGVDVTGLAALADRHGGQAFRLAPDTPAPGAAIAQALARLVPIAPGQAGPPRPADRSEACLLLGLLALLLDLAVRPPRLGRAGRLEHPGRRSRRGRPGRLGHLGHLRHLGLILLLATDLATSRPVLAASSAATLVDRGLHFLEQGQFPEARDAFLAARARDPDAAIILYDLGTAYYRLGRFDLAQGAFDRAATTGRGKLSAAARYNQGNAAYRRGDLETAARCYVAALDADPSDAAARANLELVRKRQAAPAPEHVPLPDDRAKPAPPDEAKPSPAGRAIHDGQAPAPQGQDQGDGASGPPPPPQHIQQGPASAEPAAPDAPAVPLAGQNGRNAGPRRTTPDAQDLDKQLERIPDLPGLPLTGTIGARPPVEKDW